jgi:hypothetical protein
MKLTPQQIEELLGVIDKYSLTFMAHHVGSDFLTEGEKATLSNAGVNLAQIKRTSYNVNQAFRFGILSDALGDSMAKGMTFAALKNHIETGKVFPLNKLQKSALQSLNIQMAGELRRTAMNIKGDVRNALVNADKIKHTVTHSTLVIDAAKKAIEDRKYVNAVVSDIGHRTGKWHRDLGRIADFVLHTAFDEGRSMNMMREGGDQALVYKDVYAGACHHCTRLLLTGGVGSEPKLFTLAELKANGTNVGKKVGNWLPVIGPVHPWCRCTLQRPPFGMTRTALTAGEWEWNGNDFKLTDKYKPKVARKSKVEITIGDKKISV